MTEAISEGTAADQGVNVRRLNAVVAKIGDLPADVKEVVAQVTRLSGRLQPAEPDT